MYTNLVNYFGGVKELADALGITRHAIYQWKGVIPKDRAYQIEVITKGRFKASDIQQSTEAA